MQIKGLRNDEGLGEVVAYLRSDIAEGPLLFLVDTGCSKTTISGLDSLRLGIDDKRLRKGADDSGVGGSVRTYTLANITLTFIDTKGKQHHHKMKSVDVFSLSKEMLPSLLGIDFLQEYAISYSKEYCYLDSKN